MQKKDKKQRRFRNSMDESTKLKNYRMLESVTTMHPVLDEPEAEKVKKAIEKMPDIHMS
ncbi:MAG: hypothetical protein SOW08_00170 [Lachnospiraceae bacterium]|nr:hypothetical protein [Lachnospiraceae bacterium]